MFSSPEETKTKVMLLYRTLREVFEGSMDNQKLGEAFATASNIIRDNNDKASELLSQKLSPEDFLDEVLARIRSSPSQSAGSKEQIERADQANTTASLTKPELALVSQGPVQSTDRTDPLSEAVRPPMSPRKKLPPQPPAHSEQQSSQSSTDDVLMPGHGGFIHEVTQLPFITTTRDMKMAEDDELQKQPCDDRSMVQAILTDGAADGVDREVTMIKPDSSRTATVPSSDEKSSVFSLPKRFVGWVAGTIPKANLP
jgi:hypothetical protein